MPPLPSENNTDISLKRLLFAKIMMLTLKKDTKIVSFYSNWGTFKSKLTRNPYITSYGKQKEEE